MPHEKEMVALLNVVGKRTFGTDSIWNNISPRTPKMYNKQLVVSYNSLKRHATFYMTHNQVNRNR